MGGQVTLQPDTAITHVICDRNSASILARELGLQTLSELPLGTVCVKWQWVVDCKMSVSPSFLTVPHMLIAAEQSLEPNTVPQLSYNHLDPANDFDDELYDDPLPRVQPADRYHRAAERQEHQYLPVSSGARCQ